MANGKRASILSNSRNRDVVYWKKKGFTESCSFMPDKGHRAGVNRKIKKLTMHRERLQVSKWLKNISIEDL